MRLVFLSLQPGMSCNGRCYSCELLRGVINAAMIFANGSKNFIDWFHQRRGPKENILIMDVLLVDEIFMQGAR